MRMPENRRIRNGSRLTLFIRDARALGAIQCQYCGEKTDLPQIDHVVPRSEGGDDSFGNLVTCCGGCNQLKGNALLPETDELLEVIHARVMTTGDRRVAREIATAFSRTADRLLAVLDWVELGLGPVR
jgi:hypothetical protein